MKVTGALTQEVGWHGRQVCGLDLTLLGYGGLGPNACTGDRSRPGNVITALTYSSEDPLGDLHPLYMCPTVFWVSAIYIWSQLLLILGQPVLFPLDLALDSCPV